MKLLLASFLLLSVLCAAQIPDDQKTWDDLNGRFWIGHTATAKIDFLIGYSEAWAAWKRTEPNGLLVNAYFPTGIPFSELRQGLDQFYAAPENLIIPISEAIMFWTMKANGKMTPEQLSAKIAEAIRLFRDAPSRKKQ